MAISLVDITRRKLREERVGRLQELTAALAAAVGAHEVAEASIALALTLGAVAGVVVRLSDDGQQLIRLHATGFLSASLAPRQRLPTEGPLQMLSDAIHWLEPVILESWGERVARYGDSPEFSEPGHRGAAIALPLSIEGAPVGAIGLVFPEDRTFDAEERGLLLTLADLCAQALERARLFEAVKAAETHYRRFFERSADAVLVFDEQVRCQDANPTALDLLGCHRDALLGRTIAEIAIAGLSTDAEFERLRADSTWHGELELRRTDGTLVPVEARATVIPTARGCFSMVAARDISERRHLERLQQEFFVSVSHDLKKSAGSAQGSGPTPPTARPPMGQP